MIKILLYFRINKYIRDLSDNYKLYTYTAIISIIKLLANLVNSNRTWNALKNQKKTEFRIIIYEFLSNFFRIIFESNFKLHTIGTNRIELKTIRMRFEFAKFA